MDTTSERIEQALRGVIDPELGADIVELGMVKRIGVDDGTATIGVALTIAACPLRDQIEQDVKRKVLALPEIDDVLVQVSAMTGEEKAELMSKARWKAREDAEPTMIHPATRVIAVGSGKGGVGKSSTSVNLAVALGRQGLRVGLLDADIWGFSIPRMLGVSAMRLEANDAAQIIPIEAHGVSVVSTGLLVDDENKALMWRGLMLSKALEQFLKDVAWDMLDYLVIDMPPGTGDIQMALSRLLPQAEMVVVTTPQRAAQKVASRVADMARRSFMPVIGVLENMSGFTTEHGDHYKLFGEGGGQELADDLGVPLVGQIPLDPFIVQAGDSGVPLVISHPESPAAGELINTAKRIVELVPPAEDETCTARIDRLIEGLQRIEG